MTDGSGPEVDNEDLMSQDAPPRDDQSNVDEPERASISEPEPQLGSDASEADGRLALIVFTATTFLSAVLLFSIQPMFAKMVLPVLGGSPSVWAVAMCFFQAALLVGYCYSHGLIRYLPIKRTGLVHLVVCVVACLALPIALPADWGEPPTGEPYLWQLGLFTVAVGLPFAAVAANAPLLQAWFAAAGGSRARDPYFLYAASNLGSLLALLSYPLVLEPAFGLKALSVIWTWGFLFLVGGLAACFWLVYRLPNDANLPANQAGSSEVPTSNVGWQDRLAWVGLALVPSALLTAFTTHVTTDIASAPLLWVVPLSLYLLTFVLVFQEKPLVPLRVLLIVHLAAVIFALLQLSQTKHENWFLSSTAGVIVFFTSALVAHRTLYESRPPARNLTEFYLWMSLGGVLGGLFAALIAPKMFSEVLEYPLLLALTLACRPGALGVSLKDTRELTILALIAAIGGLMMYWLPWIAHWLGLSFGEWGITPVLVAILAAVLLAFYQFPARQLVAGIMMCLAIILLPSGVKRGEAQRSYFGVYRVMLSEDGNYNVFQHGTTLHGAQRLRGEDGKPLTETVPGTYYYPQSPMAKAIEIVRANKAKKGALGRYGVIGLGAGSLACLSKPDEKWRFFEIDPVVVNIASASGHFTYLANCQPKTDIVLGDARLTMAKEQDKSFDLIIVDAFTSDAIPVHLTTAEALQLYEQKLQDDGVAVLHISNRYLDLEAVLGATLVKVPDLKGIIVSDDAADGSYDQTSSTVAVFSRSQDVLDSFRALDGSRNMPLGKVRPWTDDSSDILGPFLSKLRD